MSKYNIAMSGCQGSLPGVVSSSGLRLGDAQADVTIRRRTPGRADL